MTRLAERTARTAGRRPLQMRGLKLTVLSGGPSAEREVSLASGRAVAAALRSVGHDVEIADIRPSDLSALSAPADVIFIALHGTFGEDGELQRILEKRGLLFCGSDSASSARAMDKVIAKRHFVEAGVPTPRFDVVKKARIGDICRKWPLPAVVKPISQGSSVDCHIVREVGELKHRLEQVVGIYGSCLIEEYIDGPELTVGILGEQALPVCEIRTPRAFYDYEAKYRDDRTRYIFDDIPLPVDCLEAVQAQSLAAHRSLGCRDFTRVDWCVDARTLLPYCLEVNTIPGFTDHSLLPKAAARADMSFAQLCQRIVELALQR